MDHVSFWYSPAYQAYDMGATHPLKPRRLSMTRDLLATYGAFGPDGWLDERSPQPASGEDAALVHSADYIGMLRRVNDGRPDPEMRRYYLGTSDNPLFAGIWDSSLVYTGATIAAAEDARHTGGRAINISGGLHHAQRAEASGFCVLNDLAVAIARLLRSVDRVAYIDIDAHHGDGVQAIFYDDPRVLTISLHESGRSLFPGTGDASETGTGDGAGYSLNVPLMAGTDDETYLWAFDAVVPPAIVAFRPDVLVTQLGADDHFADPLAHLALTTSAYEEIFSRFDAMGRPWAATGGGGYNLRTVPRVWTLACAAMARRNPPNALPDTLSAGEVEWYGGTLRDATGPDLDPGDRRAARAFAEESVRGLRRLVPWLD